MADPGFPIGGHQPVREAIDLQRGHFLVKMYAKTKELGPAGGGMCWARPLANLRSANGIGPEKGPLRVAIHQINELILRLTTVHSNNDVIIAVAS